MAAKKTVVRKISDLKVTFYVRTALDEEHVLKLATLLQAGEELPPISITQTNSVIDGRHRIEAYKLIDRTEINCVVDEETNSAELIAKALGANEGGSKVPTQNDIVHSFVLMLQSGAAEKKIYEIAPYPKAVTRRYLANAQSKVAAMKIRAAKEAIAEGMSVKDAAVEFNIDVQRLKDAIAGRKNINKQNIASALRTVIRNHNFKCSRGVGGLLKKVTLGVVDGDVSAEIGDDIFSYETEMLTRQVLRLEDWKKRFDAAKRGQLTNWKDLADEQESE